MAETEERKKRQRKPSDEIDPETGEPYSDIPGVEYPAEMEAAESLLFAGRPSTSILSNISKKAESVIAGQAKKKALELMKEKMPSVGAAKQEPIMAVQESQMAREASRFGKPVGDTAYAGLKNKPRRAEYQGEEVHIAETIPPIVKGQEPLHMIEYGGLQAIPESKLRAPLSSRIRKP